MLVCWWCRCGPAGRCASDLKIALLSCLSFGRLNSALENAPSLSNSSCAPSRVFRVLGLFAFLSRRCACGPAALAVGGLLAAGCCLRFRKRSARALLVAPRRPFCALRSRLFGLRVFVRVLAVAFCVLLGVLVVAFLCRRLAAARFSENSLRFAPSARCFVLRKFLKILWLENFFRASRFLWRLGF